jgi:hypothetical protein
MLSFSIIIVSALILGVWILIEIKRMRHKFFAIFLIALILFTYISFSTVIKNKDVDLKTTEGLTKASKIYFLWLGSAFNNVKSITTNAIQANWSSVQEDNKTSSAQR